MPSPFRQWYQGQEPWWAKDEEEQSLLAQSEMGESEADTDVGSTSPEGPHGPGRGRYYYLLVSLFITVALPCNLPHCTRLGWAEAPHHTDQHAKL